MNCRLPLSACLVLALLPVAGWSETSVKGVTVVAGAETLAGTRVASDKRPERQDTVYFESGRAGSDDIFTLTDTERSELRRQIEEAAADVYGGKRIIRRAAGSARP